MLLVSYLKKIQISGFFHKGLVLGLSVLLGQSCTMFERHVNYENYKIPDLFFSFTETIGDTIIFFDTDSNKILLTVYKKDTIEKEYIEDYPEVENHYFYEIYTASYKAENLKLELSISPTLEVEECYFLIDFLLNETDRNYFEFTPLENYDAYVNDSIIEILENEIVDTYSDSENVHTSTLLIKKSIGFVSLRTDKGDTLYLQKALERGIF